MSWRRSPLGPRPDAPGQLRERLAHARAVVRLGRELEQRVKDDPSVTDDPKAFADWSASRLQELRLEELRDFGAS